MEKQLLNLETVKDYNDGLQKLIEIIESCKLNTDSTDGDIQESINLYFDMPGLMRRTMRKPLAKLYEEYKKGTK